MMFPMELRACREANAQQQYEPFRTTVFTHRRDDLAAARGPGTFFREEWNSLATNAHRFKPLSLYRTEREVNPTPTATVQRFYNPQESTDVGSQLKRKGNTVPSLKSNVPRFDEATEETRASQRGPGSYYPDKFQGAFPALCQKITPRSVCLEKLQAKRALAATFGIVPVPPAAGIGSAVATFERPARIRAPKSTGDSAILERRRFTGSLDIPLEMTRLAPALTPRNAYENPKNRQYILAMRPAEQPRDSESPR